MYKQQKTHKLYLWGRNLSDICLSVYSLHFTCNQHHGHVMVHAACGPVSMKGRRAGPADLRVGPGAAQKVFEGLHALLAAAVLHSLAGVSKR